MGSPKCNNSSRVSKGNGGTKNRVSDVECTGCLVWFSPAALGLDGKTKKEIEAIDVLCIGCLRRENMALKERMAEMEENMSEMKETIRERTMRKKSVEVQVEGCEWQENRGQARAEKAEKQEKAMQTVSEKKVMIKKAKVTRLPIKIIGDSISRKLPEEVSFTMKESSCTSMGGADVREICKKAKEDAAGMKEGMVIIQAGGNRLERVGCEAAVEEVMEAVKTVDANVSVAVIGVIKRPREGEEYERMRKKTNKKMFEKLQQLKIQRLQEKKGNVSFLDFDAVLEERMYSDGVHLNSEGYDRVGRRLREWVRARSLQFVHPE